MEVPDRWTIAASNSRGQRFKSNHWQLLKMTKINRKRPKLPNAGKTRKNAIGLILDISLFEFKKPLCICSIHIYFFPLGGLHPYLTCDPIHLFSMVAINLMTSTTTSTATAATPPTAAACSRSGSLFIWLTGWEECCCSRTARRRGQYCKTFVYLTEAQIAEMFIHDCRYGTVFSRQFRASLVSANLSCAKLLSTNLSDKSISTNLSCANLSCANLSCANLSGRNYPVNIY